MADLLAGGMLEQARQIRELQAERDALQARLAEFEQHEAQTHDAMEAMLGKSDGFVELTRKLLGERDALRVQVDQARAWAKAWKAAAKSFRRWFGFSGKYLSMYADAHVARGKRIRSLEAQVQRQAKALRECASRGPNARGMFKRFGIVFDRWPVQRSGEDWTANRFAALDTETRWRGIAFTLYTMLCEVESIVVTELEERALDAAQATGEAPTRADLQTAIDALREIANNDETCAPDACRQMERTAREALRRIEAQATHTPALGQGGETQ